MTNEEFRQKNWVELRAACTIHATFDKLIDVIKSDVEQFNKLPPQKRNDQKYTCWSESQGGISVREVNGSGEWLTQIPPISAQICAASIQIFREQEPLFEVRQEWNNATLSCDLKVDGKCLSLWQISQKAIGDLLFGHG